MKLKLLRWFIYGIPLYLLLSLVQERLDQGPAWLNLPVMLFQVGWMLLGLVALPMMLLSRPTREAVFAQVFAFRQRDEREEMITDRAAKSSFLFMLGLLFFLLLMSTSRYGSVQDPIDTGTYHGQYTIGHVQIRAHSLQKVDTSVPGLTYDLYDFPLSKTGLLLVMLMLQLGAFKFFTWQAGRHDG